MTVSGLGSARTPHPPVTPVHRPAKAEKVTDGRNAFDHLTAADRELIYEVTGQRIAPGFDPARQSASGFAAALAAERSAGRLAPGQPVTAVYLKDLNRRCERAPGPNPVGPYLAKAVDYLSRVGDRHFDISA
jgi:hypothetical protein